MGERTTYEETGAGSLRVHVEQAADLGHVAFIEGKKILLSHESGSGGHVVVDVDRVRNGRALRAQHENAPPESARSDAEE